jgi:hypothetical protein
MPLVAQIVCDTCHAVKRATNHWYVISLENNSFCFKPLALALAADWATKHFSESSLQYFCGRFCAVEALTGWMTKLYKDETERSYLGDQHNRSTLQGFPIGHTSKTKTVSK